MQKPPVFGSDPKTAIAIPKQGERVQRHVEIWKSICGGFAVRNPDNPGAGSDQHGAVTILDDGMNFGSWS
jgi:hypothetical protein